MPINMKTVAQKLARRLNEIPAFRNQFINDTKAALATVGINVDEEKAASIREHLSLTLLAKGEPGSVPFIYPP